ncbi:MAG: hypothetical protein AAFP90_07400 [Planctomycetota bacterium]
MEETFGRLVNGVVEPLSGVDNGQNGGTVPAGDTWQTLPGRLPTIGDGAGWQYQGTIPIDTCTMEIVSEFGQVLARMESIQPTAPDTTTTYRLIAGGIIRDGDSPRWPRVIVYPDSVMFASENVGGEIEPTPYRIAANMRGAAAIRVTAESPTVISAYRADRIHSRESAPTCERPAPCPAIYPYHNPDLVLSGPGLPTYGTDSWNNTQCRQQISRQFEPLNLGEPGQKLQLHYSDYRLVGNDVLVSDLQPGHAINIEFDHYDVDSDNIGIRAAMMFTAIENHAPFTSTLYRDVFNNLTIAAHAPTVSVHVLQSTATYERIVPKFDWHTVGTLEFTNDHIVASSGPESFDYFTNWNWNSQYVGEVTEGGFTYGAYEVSINEIQSETFNLPDVVLRLTAGH